MRHMSPLQLLTFAIVVQKQPQTTQQWMAMAVSQHNFIYRNRQCTGAGCTQIYKVNLQRFTQIYKVHKLQISDNNMWSHKGD